MKTPNAHSASLATALLFLSAALSVAALPAQERRLGFLEFKNSGAAAAQSSFITGVLLLHSFEFEDARVEFTRAQQIDPEFALAYWGEAMTFNHPLWRQQDKPAALAALERYAGTARARQLKAPTPREAAYLETLDVLYGEGSKTQRDEAYMNAMRRLASAYPDDLEASAFYSLAILGSTDGERDFATYMRAAAVAQTVSARNPDHPGGVHYTIHSFDDPVHAPLGLTAARAYSDIAPDAGHAQHMTAHIFVALGMWDELVTANVRARDLQNRRREELGRTPNPCGHYTSWLHYGWLQQGKLEDAERGMAECHERVLAGGTASEVRYFVGMRGRHVLDLMDWDAADRLSAEVDHPGYDFITGIAAMHRGKKETAQSILDALDADPSAGDPRQRIAYLELAALMAFSAGDGDTAIANLTEAAALEESLPFEFGPPASLQPPHEMLGRMYLMSHRPEEAARAFRQQLEFTPQRTGSLEGLATSASAVGDDDAATDARRRLAEIWKHADPDFRERHSAGAGH